MLLIKIIRTVRRLEGGTDDRAASTGLSGPHPLAQTRPRLWLGAASLAWGNALL